MWLLTALLLCVPVCGQVADSTSAVITLQPPWVSVFSGESVLLQCEGPRVPGNSSTQWFLNGTAIHTWNPKYSILEASATDSGEYTCQTPLSRMSDPVQLEVHRDWLLLQPTGRVLTEGEPLTLRCYGWKNKVVYNVLFYQNGKTFKYSPRDTEVTILKTNASHSGIYHCSGKGKQLFTSAGVPITVNELFAAPVLTASWSSPLPEGSLVNLSCETKLLLPRPGMQLYFSFHLGSKTLQDRNTSAEYQILTFRREDSGSYWCEVATEDGTVVKRSPELELGLMSTTPVWFHILFYLSLGTMFLVDTVLCINTQNELQRKKEWTLDISLPSDNRKRINSYIQEDRQLEEEVKC